MSRGARSFPTRRCELAASPVRRTGKGFAPRALIAGGAEMKVAEGTVRIYWHGELPPLQAEPVGEHIIEATSKHVRTAFLHHEQLWEQCHADLMAQVQERLEQEAARVGGDCVHVLNENIEAKHDGAKGESWLCGRFTYMLYRTLEGTDVLPD